MSAFTSPTADRSSPCKGIPEINKGRAESKFCKPLLIITDLSKQKPIFAIKFIQQR